MSKRDRQTREERREKLQKPPKPKREDAPTSEPKPKGNADWWGRGTGIAGVLIALGAMGISCSQFNADQAYKARERAEKATDKAVKTAETNRQIASFAVAVADVDATDTFLEGVRGFDFAQRKGDSSDMVQKNASMREKISAAKELRSSGLEQARFYANRLGIDDDRTFKLKFGSNPFSTTRIANRFGEFRDNIITIYGIESSKVYGVRYELRKTYLAIFYMTAIAGDKADIQPVIDRSLEFLTTHFDLNKEEWSSLNADQRSIFYQKFADDFKDKLLFPK